MEAITYTRLFEFDSGKLTSSNGIFIFFLKKKKLLFL